MKASLVESFSCFGMLSQSIAQNAVMDVQVRID